MVNPRIRFGPAGIPIQCDGRSTLDGVRCCKELGLDAMEIEFVQGVRLKETDAEKVRTVAEELDISLSSHAPYFINFCSKEKEKIATSRRNLIQAAEITQAAGGRLTVFHPGFYQNQTKEEAFQRAAKNLREVATYLKERKIKTMLGAETVGKPSQFGGLDEVLKLAHQVDGLLPVLDLAHMHARGDFNIKDEDAYRNIFSVVEKELGSYFKNFHFHFSEIEFTAKGERNHLPLGIRGIPPFKPLLKVLVENGYSGTIISESPKLDIDAQLMKTEYERLCARLR
ncbi:MAG: TIM barrel protein [Candidatus Bilamarchaeaceae archaeon]